MAKSKKPKKKKSTSRRKKKKKPEVKSSSRAKSKALEGKAPHEIRDQVKKWINAAFLEMTSSKWDIALRREVAKLSNQKDKEQLQTKAALLFLALQRAKLRMGNLELAKVRDKLKENEAALEAGRLGLEKSLKKLTKVQQVLTAVSGFLDVIGRVVKLA